MPEILQIAYFVALRAVNSLESSALTVTCEVGYVNIPRYMPILTTCSFSLRPLVGHFQIHLPNNGPCHLTGFPLFVSSGAAMQS
ncbi:hypothetical protein DPMN_025702 [Dreissena polymorpha]|uniref:Uncharacterized protein n=1 Tax=Dreissena polymorpha TaxID=45954 RepID=A0A9D4LRY8_DREPO|nr:hypothetical protein DPMN_025702 [Dreissena polymorpha]